MLERGLEPGSEKQAEESKVVSGPHGIIRGRFMSNWEDEVNRHAAELVKLTLKAADQGPEPLPEDEVAKLGMVIATECWVRRCARTSRPTRPGSSGFARERWSSGGPPISFSRQRIPRNR
jgi:hypothetical protein